MFKNFTNNELFNVFKKYFHFSCLQITSFQIVILLCQLFLGSRGASNLFLILFIYLLGIINYSLFSELETNEKGLLFLKINTVIFASSIINHIFISLILKLKNNPSLNSIDLSLIPIICLIFSMIVVLCFIMLYQKKETKDFFNYFKDITVINVLTGKLEELQTGDVILGEYKEDKDSQSTKKGQLILPFKDRFLHMLILGPTGSGKTSQTIIPMINQDLKNKKFSIIVIEPKSDLAEKVWAMGEHYDREVIYFNPILPSCPYFNPLYGDESDAVETLSTTFRMLNPDSPTFFLDQAENLIRKAVKLLKRLYGNDANLIMLNNLVWNVNGKGENMVKAFRKITPTDPLEMNENEEISAWFINDYFTGSTGEMRATKSYEHCSGVRTQISKLCSNKYLRRVLNPPPGIGTGIDFDSVFNIFDSDHPETAPDGKVISIATAQGSLGALGSYLGYFIILQLQASVFRRKGNENTRTACMLYIDEFQTYANSGFTNMLTQGRSYRVASHLATQNRALIAGSGRDGKAFLEMVSTNARNTIIYPGGNALDAKYYSDQFGEIIKRETQVGITRQIFNPIYGLKLNNPSKSERTTEKTDARFSASAIIYRPFGEITVCIISKNSIQPPTVATIEFIPKELNKELDDRVSEYNKQEEEKETIEYRPHNKVDVDIQKEIIDNGFNKIELDKQIELQKACIENEEDEEIEEEDIFSI